MLMHTCKSTVLAAAQLPGPLNTSPVMCRCGNPIFRSLSLKRPGIPVLCCALSCMPTWNRRQVRGHGLDGWLLVVAL